MRTGLVVALLLWSSGGAVGAQAPPQEVTGTLHVLWGDPPAGSPVLRYLLSGDDGVARMLDVDESVVAAAGGLMLVNGSRMRVQLAAAPTPQGRERARVLSPLTTDASRAMAAESPAASQLAQLAVTRPFVTILCRFADSVDELPGTRARYEQLMGGTFPGVNHYWTEVTGGGITLDGSVVVGWYTLPEPRSAYVNADNSSADLNKLLTDCTGVADPDVDYARFHGINMQFNKNLDCCSWGGGRTMTLDGVTRFWGTTWEAAWATLGTYAHEVGHSLGLPHSGGPYGSVYDSYYDVMSSSSWYRDAVTDFRMGSHTVGYHKDRLGAIPAARRVVAAAPVTRVALERSALPRANGGAQLVIVPVREETGEFYTIESRGGTGYDTPLARALVIHYVNPRRSEPAQVVDVDGNGNVNDAGAQWVAKELFRDLRHDIAVLVDSVRDDLVHITVRRGERPWLVLAPGTHVHRVPYGSTAVVQDSASLETSAGLAWQATTARRRAQVLNPAGSGSTVLRWQRITRGVAPGIYVDTIRVLAPGASGHLAFIVDSLIVAEAAGQALTLSASAIARADSVFQGLTGFADSVSIRFTGIGAEAVAWTVMKSRGTTVLQSLSSGVGNGVVRWYHYANVGTPGVYVDTLVVTAPGASNSPLLIVDSLHVHAPPAFTITRFGAGPAAVPEGSTLRDSVLITPTGRWETAGTWQPSYQGAASYIRLLDQRRFAGPAVLSFERRAEGRAPGLYVDTVRLAPTVPGAAGLLIDTMEVQPSPLALQLSWNSRRDSVVVDVAQHADSVLVITTGPGASTRGWSASVTSSWRITLARRDAFTAAGRGTGTGWLRWFRNVGGRVPGLYVDTIRISYADTALSVLLVDSVTVLQALAASVSAPARSAYMLPGGSSRDSVQLMLLGQGSAEAAWTAQANAAWLTLDAGGGVGPGWLRWTRTAGGLPVGTYVDTIRIAVQDAGGATAVIDSLRIVAPIAIDADSLRPVVPVGRVYADSLRASGGSGTYTWTLADGALPDGLTLGAASGVIGGQATSASRQRVTVRATSSGFSATQALVYVVLPPPAVVTDSVRPQGVLGQSYADTLRATGGDGAHEWSITSGELPPGLVLSAAGVIAGTPTQAGSTRALAQVTSAGLTAAVPLRLTVVGPVRIVSASGLRPALMGAPYADTLRASGGVGAIAWSVSEGSLPPGVALDAATGVLSGVPEQAGEFVIGIRAAAAGIDATAAFQLTVAKPVVPQSAVLDQLLGGAALSTDQARFLDLLGNRNGRVDVGDVRAWLRDTGRLDTAATTELQQIIERMDPAASRKEIRR